MTAGRVTCENRLRSEPRVTLRPRFFFNLVPEVGVALSACCGRFFHAEDLELEVLKGGGACPLCGGAPSEE